MVQTRGVKMRTYWGNERRNAVSKFEVDRTWGSPVTGEKTSPIAKVAASVGPYLISVLGHWTVTGDLK